MNLYLVGGILAAFILYSGIGGYMVYNRGKDDQANYQLKVDFAQAQKDLEDGQKNNDRANTAGQNFENQKPQIVERVRERTREIIIPPDADPFVPVWFVRMQHRLSRDEPLVDPYPGESDAALSRTRLSGTREMLTGWAQKYDTCRAAVDGIRELKPVLPPPPPEPSFFDKLNPF